jgi:hypothetical protein
MLDPFVAGVGRSNAWGTLAAAAIFQRYHNRAFAVSQRDHRRRCRVADAAANDSVYFTGYAKITWTNYGDDGTEA